MAHPATHLTIKESGANLVWRSLTVARVRTANFMAANPNTSFGRKATNRGISSVCVASLAIPTNTTRMGVRPIAIIAQTGIRPNVHQIPDMAALIPPKITKA